MEATLGDLKSDACVGLSDAACRLFFSVATEAPHLLADEWAFLFQRLGAEHPLLDAEASESWTDSDVAVDNKILNFGELRAAWPRLVADTFSVFP
jgi:hypothetical protein